VELLTFAGYPTKLKIIKGRKKSLSLLNEVKRRNVLRIAAAYPVVAWLLMLLAAGSTGRSNTLVKSFRWCFIV